MPTRKLLLDTNLLSVLAVGLADVSYLSVQKGFKAYGPEDFRALKSLLLNHGPQCRSSTYSVR
jgi:hypothetical protein